MFIVSLTYIQPISEVEKHLDAHIAFLDRQYARDRIIFSGRKNPRTGGVIVAHNLDLAELNGMIAEDPFHQHGIAGYEITEVIPTRSAKAFEAFL